MDATIRNADRDDAEVIVRHNAALALETENKHLDQDVLSTGVRRLLDDPDRGRYFIAEVGADIAGQLMLTREWSDWRNGWFLWIQSVYVRPQHRRSGVFRRLYDHVVGLATQDDDICGIRLYVERENHSAIDTYLALKMRQTDYLLLEREF